MTLLTDHLTEGYRTALDVILHDVDSRSHQVCVDYPAEQLDAHRTSFASGCFADSFRRNPHMPMLVHHNPADLIGHSISAQSVGPVHRVVAQFSDLDVNPLAKRYFAHIRDGDIPGWSYHFVEAHGEPHPTVRGGVRFTRATMKEFGPTPAPSIPGVTVSGLRSEPDLEGEKWAQAQDAFQALRRLRSFPDDQGTLALRALQGLRSL